MYSLPYLRQLANIWNNFVTVFKYLFDLVTILRIHVKFKDNINFSTFTIPNTPRS